MKPYILAVALSCLAPAASTAQATSRWTTSSSQDPMDDSRTYYVTTTGKAVASNGRSIRPSLSINCSPGGLLHVTILTRGLVIDSHLPGGVDVMVRVDTETAQETEWLVGGNFQMMMSPFTTSDSLIPRMLAHRRLLMHIPVYPGELASVEFQIAGFDPKLAWLKQQCGINP